jgi:hypothetical protein
MWISRHLDPMTIGSLLLPKEERIQNPPLLSEGGVRGGN